MYRINFKLLIFCVFGGVRSSLSQNITACRRSDTPCITRNVDVLVRTAIKGVSSMHIKSLDPVYHNLIEGKFISVGYKMHNSTMIGLKDCSVSDAQLALEKKSLQFKLVCPYVYMFGLYEISGILIIVPIEGNGDFRLDCRDYDIYVKTETEITQNQDGKSYLNLKNFEATGDLKGGMIVDLRNLFNGQHKELADAALKFANNYWKPVANELQGPVINANVKRVLKNLNKYLKRITLDEIITY